MKPRLRFAPSPSGYLHVGGARTALFNWLWARKTGGTFILRFEDTDQARSTIESRAAILEALQWLGLDWDEGPDPAGGPDRGARGPYVQSERRAIYRRFADTLIRDGKAYRCFCTKDELAAQRDAVKQRDPKAEFKYPGTCRARTDEPDLPHVVRFKTETAGQVVYFDKVFRRVPTPNTELQDFVLLRTDGLPLYNFGAVVDDITMDVTVVARGRDHMINTPPQILLYQALCARIPDFAHLPMMLGNDGEKLSKRHGAVSVTEYRDRGFSRDAVLDYLSRFGWSAGEREVRLSRAELIAAFDWAQCGRRDGMFDPQKFLAVAHDHLKSPRLVPDADYVAQLLPFVQRRGLDVTPDDLRRALPMIRARAQTFVQAADLIDPLVREPPILDEGAAATHLVPANASRLRDVRITLADVEWTPAAVEAALGATMREIGQPLRVALTGRTASPSLYDVLMFLGRDRSLARLDRVIAIADR